jgi:hypothetical protein
MKTSALALSVALTTLAGCGGGVTVKPSGTDLHLQPLPKDCSLEFLQKAPGRPYDELADLTAHVTKVPAAGAAEVLHEKACALGADAVIVTREFVTNPYGHTLVAGTAIKYKLLPPTQAEPQSTGL